MKYKKTMIGFAAILVCIAVFVGIYQFTRPKTMAGSKKYTVTVVDSKGEQTSYKASTDQKYLLGALKELDKNSDFSIAGKNETYGFFITTVNGKKVNYDKHKTYWAIYVNGKYGQNGCESQPVTDGDSYRLVYETSK